MKFIIQLLKIGAFFSLLFFCLIGFITIPSLSRSPLVLKVQNKYISANSYVIEGVTDNGGIVTADYSQLFFNKAQIGDTIRFNLFYRLLVKDRRTESIYVRERVWLMLALIVSSLFPILIFLPNSRILRQRSFYWLIGASELVNIFCLITILITLFVPQ